MWKHTVFSVDSNKIITWLVYPLVGWGRNRVYLHSRRYILMPPAHPFTKLSTICSIALRSYLSSSGFDDCCRIFGSDYIIWSEDVVVTHTNTKFIKINQKPTKNYLLFDVSTSVRGLHQRSKRQKVGLNNFWLVLMNFVCLIQPNETFLSGRYSFRGEPQRK